MNDDLISVILPVWNPDITQLKECIDSIIEQTYPNFEIILVYQKKPDCDEKFYDLMSKYNDSRLKVMISKKGVCTARNVGIKNAAGKYIAIMDGDDICEKERFEKQLKFMKDNGCNVVGSWAYSIANDGKILAKIKYPIKHDEIRKKIMFHDVIINPSVIMEKQVLDDVGLYDVNLAGSEDYDLWFRAMSKDYKFGNIPEFLLRLRENPDSVTRGNEWRKHRITSMKVRNRAFFLYGFRKPIDILYHIITPLSFFISPSLLFKIKKMMGWYEE